MLLKNNVVTRDPRLDRVPQFDEQSREYPIRQLVVTKSPRSYTWRVNSWLDQGQEGACVGFSWSHELAGRPKEVKNISNETARAVYNKAKQLDEWAGENYEGTSVLAGAKAVQEQGYVKEYRWAFGIDDLILAVGHQGPAVLGLNWYSDMFDTDEKGFIHASGSLMGGHAIVCHGVSVKGQYFKLHNSWGKEWGVNGECKISFEDMARLLAVQGEACIPVTRTLK
jgi:hypothetical protein